MNAITTQRKPMNLMVEKEQGATHQCESESCCARINDIRETLSRIRTKDLKDIFCLYEHMSSLDPCTERLKNAAGLLLGLKQVWETTP